ncbi:MAG: ribosomal L7Ae/L30e/S12e/Gadd45 family protein [Clostridia bacterium]|nr:ribosomal L7Ae/L30e/S12e/Gadd45 family protein [Clostridia bacterium]
MNDKLLSLLGMCRRAGKLEIGFSKTADAIENGKACLVIIAADTAARTEKEVRFKGRDRIPVSRIPHSAEILSHAIGVQAGTVTVTYDGFAKQALLLIDNGGMNI